MTAANPAWGATEAQIAEHIKIYLRNAPDRCGGCNERTSAKAVAVTDAGNDKDI